jgi:hypothetical protein
LGKRWIISYDFPEELGKGGTGGKGMSFLVGEALAFKLFELGTALADAMK